MTKAAASDRIHHSVSGMEVLTRLMALRRTLTILCLHF